MVIKNSYRYRKVALVQCDLTEIMNKIYDRSMVGEFSLIITLTGSEQKALERLKFKVGKFGNSSKVTWYHRSLGRSILSWLGFNDD